MNTHKVFKNQELFSFAFQGQKQTSKWQFIIALNENFKEDTAKMLGEDKNHTMNIDTFAEFQLNIDIGINMFYFAFIKVMSYQHRRSFLDWQYEQCKPEARLTFLYRLEALACMNYWYAFGENSFYNPDTENEVNEWLLEKFSGKQKSKIILAK